MSRDGSDSSNFQDPYADWAKAQGIPIATGFGVDLLALDVRPWARLGATLAMVKRYQHVLPGLTVAAAERMDRVMGR